ncbi:MAG: hypothetical protein QM212_02740 [Bacteroidota bacterium]|jgi:hypothetical protein|nr:hypothetical protein [Bacteroidales bacterium]MDI9534883.1 hypothetical protein [Bacteroidota bacterium]NLP21171.1 hypothetical protein [Bacteroidales bacterium]HNY45193.1 hypothetical protein [Bacteroidales bacterium]HOD88593.1 hypothetical protein [Bacteroidales bacterium]
MKFRIFLFLIFISSLTSCSINGSFQGLFSYYKKTKKEGKINFLKFDTNNDYLNSYSDSTTIVLSNGKEIKKYLKNFEKSIIYIWSPKCKSRFCYSLNLLQEICSQKGIELFVVAEYYDSKYMSKNYKISHLIIGIDTQYYKTNLTSKYLSKFIKDLIDEVDDTTFKEIYNAKFFSFRNGKFEKSFDSIEDIK